METRNENEPEVYIKASEIEYVSYGGEHHLPLIMNLVDEELSEPYSIFTYRYFVYLWPQLSFMAFHKGKCIGTVVCKMGEHRGTFRGYIAMLVVLKPYRGKGIATELVTRSIKVMMESGCEEVCHNMLKMFYIRYFKNESGRNINITATLIKDENCPSLVVQGRVGNSLRLAARDQSMHIGLNNLVRLADQAELCVQCIFHVGNSYL